MRRILVSAALLALCALVAWVVTNALGCGAGERAVFAEFPRYGGRMPEPQSDIEGGRCFAWFVTPDPQGRVYANYSERLRERGWEVAIHEPPAWSSEPTTLDARRENYRYSVIYESDVHMPGGRRVQMVVSGWGPPA